MTFNYVLDQRPIYIYDPSQWCQQTNPGASGVCLIRILAADVVPTLVQDMESREYLWRSVVCQDS